MDYPCAKFGDFSFSRCFGFIMRTDRQTHGQTESHTDAAKRFTPATVVGVSSLSSIVKLPSHNLHRITGDNIF